jgi:hypothetical protein
MAFFRSFCLWSLATTAFLAPLACPRWAAAASPEAPAAEADPACPGDKALEAKRPAVVGAPLYPRAAESLRSYGRSASAGGAARCSEWAVKNVENIRIQGRFIASQGRSVGGLTPLSLPANCVFEDRLPATPFAVAEERPISTALSDAGPGLVVRGNAPFFEYQGLQEKLERIWHYERQKYLRPGAADADPEIHFYPFAREKESPEWVAWQNSWIRENPSIWKEWVFIRGDQAPAEITREWVDEHIASLFPFPKIFLAFHYDGTNKIQMDPERTFLAFYVNGPNGMKADHAGMGYYSAAHELLHYTLERRGVLPTRIHHCLFIAERPGKRTPIQDAVQFLIEQGIASDFAMAMGANREKDLDPCQALNAEDLALVRQYADELP